MRLELTRLPRDAQRKRGLRRGRVNGGTVTRLHGRAPIRNRGESPAHNHEPADLSGSLCICWGEILPSMFCICGALC